MKQDNIESLITNQLSYIKSMWTIAKESYVKNF